MDASIASPGFGKTARRPGRGRRGVVLLMALSLLLLYGPGLAVHVSRSMDPYRFNDDARQQVWPFERFRDTNLFRGDRAADYFLACFPPGYKALYAMAAQVMDPRALSKALPYFLLAGLCAAAGFAAARLQGKWAAWAVVAFCITTPIYLGRMGGGLPRSFAFPLYALAAAALVRGRPMLLAVVVCAGAAFYPTVAVVGGLTLAAWLLVLPARHRGQAADWPFGRCAVLLVLTAGATVVLAVPVLKAAKPWGPVLRPGDVPEYPELGPGGRYGDEDRAVGLLSRTNLLNYVRAPMAGLGGPWEADDGLYAAPRQGVVPDGAGRRGAGRVRVALPGRCSARGDCCCWRRPRCWPTPCRSRWRRSSTSRRGTSFTRWRC